MSSLSPQLNDNQKKAVEYNDGPLLIVAGAGTGKTFTLVEKIKYLILNKLAKPEEILCLTFTEKAAYEMEERVDQAMPYGYFQMWISTFHSFADEILKDDIAHIGLDPGYKLLTQAETILFLKKRLFLFDLTYFRPLGNPNKFIDGLVQHFSRLRDEDISPEQYINWAHNLQIGEEPKSSFVLTADEKEKYIELANAYKTYQDLKIKEGFFDFNDLIYYLIRLYRQRSNILEEDKKQFKYVLVDEFQDTNISQYELIKLLCPLEANPKLTVVGDDSQAIYKFRGASISNILTFMKDYPAAHQVTLNNNYRSCQTILDLSHQLIKNNNPDTLEAQLGISKQLVSSKKNVKNAVDVVLTDNAEQEADWVSTKILELQKQQGYQFSDFAILIRANNHADPFLNALNRQGIPYQFLGPGMLFKQPEVKDLIAYLKLLADLEDSPSCFRVFSMDFFNIDKQDLSLLLSFSKKTSLSLYLATEVYSSFFHEEWYRTEFQIYKKYIPLLKEDTRKKLIALVKLIKKHLSEIKSYTAGEILYDFLDQTGYIKKFYSFTSTKEEKIVLNINKFFNKIKSFENEKGREEATVDAVVDFINMSLDLGESPVASDTDVALANAVNILTVHSSKGLEFPVVFLVNLSKGRFPTTQKREQIPLPQDLIKEVLPQGDFHVQEERRLFYVGLTRAMDRAFLTTSRFYGEGKRERKVSPFIVETLGEERLRNIQSIKQDEKDQLTIFDFKKVDPPVQREVIPLKNFSYSQLESYNMCPLQYKYQYILKIPTQVNSAASFGDTIHKTLQKFYQLYLTDSDVTIDTMLSLYEELWVPLGYSSQAHMECMKNEGKEMLSNFYKNFHNPHIKIVALEKLFKIRVDDEVFITGKIDRIDSKENGHIEIIDYKTGRKPDEKELQKSLQLSIYTLAATDSGLYNKKVDEVTLTFYYLQEMEKISMTRTEAEMADVRDEIIQSVQHIKTSQFEAKVGPWCNFCVFRILCEAWQ